jgi:hypothetical protein
LKDGGSISTCEMNTRDYIVGAAALLSAAIATPALAQQAVQEPGAQPAQVGP